MRPHAELQKQNSDKVVELLLHKTSKQELKQLVEAASAAQGIAVGRSAFEPGDNICPTFKFPFPFPPHFVDFLNHVVTQNARLDVFPLGIVNPEEVLVQARLNAGS
jgi:hypothetical protein